MVRCLNSQGEILGPITPKSLRQTNILNSETAAQRLLSKEVIRVKDAPDMNFMESVRHFTFLLSEQNLEFVNGRKSKKTNILAREIEDFSETIQQALATFNSNQCEHPTTTIASKDLERSSSTENTSHIRHSSARTADVASAMFRESRSRRSQRHKSLSQLHPISESDRDRIIDRARRCLAWAYDPARAPVPGAESMNNEQVSLLACTVGHPECRKVLCD